MSWHVPSRITCSTILAGLGFADAGPISASFKQRAGVGELQVLALVVDVADVGQGKHRLAAVAFAAGHRGDGAGGRDGGLGGVADAVLPDAAHDLVPVDRRAAPTGACRARASWAVASSVLRVVDAAR